MPAQHGQIQRVISSRGLVSYEIVVWHDELGKHRTIKANDANLLSRMAETQLAQWQHYYLTQQQKAAARNAAEQTRLAREEKKLYQEEQKLSALQQTQDAAQALKEVENTLLHTLDHHDAIDWESIKDRSPFPKPCPAKPSPPPRPTPIATPTEPKETDDAYQPQIGFMDKIVTSRRALKTAEARSRFERDHAAWQENKRQTAEKNAALEGSYRQTLAAADAAHAQQLLAWEAERDAFLLEQQEQNRAIDQQQAAYLAGDAQVVLGYCDMVLSNSKYPNFMPQEWELDYNTENRVLVVDFSLPAPEDVPTLVEVKYVPTREEFTEKHLTENQAAKQYDELLYKIALRTIHELFEADVVNAIQMVGFNGYVRSIDRATGNEINNCVLSVQAKREEFMGINLANVDPKACFKQLKGVGSSKLHSITPVAPVLRIRRDDGRFVSAYDVAHHLDDGYNLAAMDWEDFEHLIREIFAKEFSANGGEVKVTQASRDGGVDAVAFDPDPIRGGKIVIQAKRYTNTVGVNAVRDLYGTVMNEGATKGILVTTSDYGPDAYEFANGKPLTLLNGANLLHLLEKHGHKAKIDLREARQMAMERTAK